MLEFRVNKEKSIHALLYAIREANGRGKLPSQYDLVKTIFLADRAHLNEFGRPVTFDTYFAMNHGPVPSFVYDTLKPNFDWLSVGRNGSPWTSKVDGRVHRFSLENAEVDITKLSVSDKRCLSDALGTVLSLSFGQIRHLTHEDRAYVAAWRDEEGTYRFPMDMSLLLDDSDDEALEDLHYLAAMASS